MYYSLLPFRSKLYTKVRFYILTTFNMNKLMRDFISNDSQVYNFKLGTVIASGLSGFIAGAIGASVAWELFIFYLK